MCQAIQEMVEEGRMEGRKAGRLEGLIQVEEGMLQAGKNSEEKIASRSLLSIEQVRELKERV